MSSFYLYACFIFRFTSEAWLLLVIHLHGYVFHVDLNVTSGMFDRLFSQKCLKIGTKSSENPST